MIEFVRRLFDTRGFEIPSARSGWSPLLIWLHNVADVMIWLAFVSIPLALPYWIWRRRRIPSQGMFWLLVAFVLAVGFTHLIQAICFQVPLYRLLALAKLTTAVMAWTSVLVLVPALPRAFELRWQPESAEMATIPGEARLPARWMGYAFALMILTLAILVRGLVSFRLTDQIPLLPFILGVAFTAWYGGLGPALVALLGGAVVLTRLFTQASGGHFEPDQAIRLGLYVVGGMMIALLIESQRVSHRKSRDSLRVLTEKDRLLEAEIVRRRQTEAELRRHQDKLNRQAGELAASQRQTAESLALIDTLIHNAPVGLGHLTASGSFLRLNPALAAIHGVSVAQHEGKTVREILPSVADEVEGYLDQVIHDGHSILDRVISGRTLGDPEAEHTWQASFYPVRVVSDSSVIGIGVVMRDISESTRVLQQLEESEARFRLLAEVVPQFVWVARPDGQVSYLNPRWYKYTGLDSSESLGHRWSDALHPDDTERAITLWKQSTETGATYEIEYRLRGVDQTYRWFLSRAIPKRDDQGRIVRWFGTCTDIDDQRRQAEILERLVRERTAELQRSNRELEQFAYISSHDLQEPLRKIQAFGDRLSVRGRAALDEQCREYLDRILISAGRMRNLINDLLTFSRVATKRQPLEPVDLERIAREVMFDLEALIQRTGGQIEVGPLPVIEADPLLMRQLFQNLLGNALKFHKADEAPIVRVECRMIPNPKPVDGSTQSPWCELEIVDNGIGFDETYLDRIFQVFQRLHGRQTYEGTGVGLAICRKIVERHEGEITARSRIGDGSTFVVRLPVTHPSEDS